MRQTAVVGVAYSGGRDSTALLHATLKAAQAQGLSVAALHVHHGLSPQADAWLAHCEAQCRRWARQGLPVSLHFERLHLHLRAGDSVEAVAREARYAALRRLALAAGAEAVLLAHHLRDQAETFLLQALRGAGVAGLAGMPAAIEREGITWLRPWLKLPREAIEAYVRLHRLNHIDDDSNEDTRFARNRLRLEVWPQLSAAFPQAEAKLADAASWAQEANACLSDLAALDLSKLVKPQGLDIDAWSGLPAHRARNALRAWVRESSGEALPAAQLERLYAELPRGRGPARWALNGGWLRRYRGCLSFIEHGSSEEVPAQPQEASVSIRRAGRYALPGWGGSLLVKRVAERGVPLARLGELALLPRSGGEQFQLEPGRPARSLKKQYQAAAVPAWSREGPLAYVAGHLVFVPGLGIDARAWGEKGQAMVALEWLAKKPAGSLR